MIYIKPKSIKNLASILLVPLYISRTNTKFSSESLDTFVARHAKKDQPFIID